MRSLSIFALAAALLIPVAVAHGETHPPIGTTTIAPWRGDRRAAFLLMFDDSIPSHVETVAPELKRRDMIGTFYVNPARGEWRVYKDQWERELPAAGMVYGNHTMTHKGAEDVADAEEEIRGCNEVILRLFPGRMPRLISFARPGVAPGKWKLTREELQPLLAKHHLISRPRFAGHGAAVNLHTAEEMLALVDRAIASGGVEHIVFHGVGGEWISTPVPVFVALLDGLAVRREQLWITDPISAHQYEIERATAHVQVIEQSEQSIRLSVSCKADPRLYDQPLTLLTRVPAGWRQCEVTQGDKITLVPNTNGVARFDAVPDGTPITLRPTRQGAPTD